MILYLHYILFSSSYNAISPILPGFFKTYTDASDQEIGFALTAFLFGSIFFKPLVCSLADRQQAHRLYLILSIGLAILGYSPLVFVPFYPDLYSNTRLAWYIFLVGCEVGRSAVLAAVSLGDCLAVNMALKKDNDSYSRMRMSGTITYCLFGLLVGQINEYPHLPKFVPGFAIALAGLLIDALILAVWKKEDFEMIEKPTSLNEAEAKCHKSSIDEGNTSQGGCINNIELVPVVSKANPDELVVKQSDPLRKKNEDSKIQLNILRMILSTDGRLIKYLILITLMGVIISPLNFIALSLEDVCIDGRCKFSQLVGLVLAAQGISEAVGFFVSPWLMRKVSRSNLLAIILALLATRYFFYANFYYTNQMSPYWMLVSECGYGLPFGILICNIVDLAFMFAEQSKLFIAHLRKGGFLDEPVEGNEQVIQQDELKVKMLLRATMQGLFGTLLDGIGRCLGSLVCSSFIAKLSFPQLWQIFAIFTFTVLVAQQLVERTQSRWSDSYNAQSAHLSG